MRKGTFLARRTMILIVAFIGFGVALTVIMALLGQFQGVEDVSEEVEIRTFVSDAANLCDPERSIDPESPPSTAGEFKLAKDRLIKFPEENTIRSEKQEGDETNTRDFQIDGCVEVSSPDGTIRPGVITYAMEIELQNDEKHLIITHDSE